MWAGLKKVKLPNYYYCCCCCCSRSFAAVGSAYPEHSGTLNTMPQLPGTQYTLRKCRENERTSEARLAHLPKARA